MNVKSLSCYIINLCEFQRFIIADPVSLTADGIKENSTPIAPQRQSSVGHCRDDTFALSSGSGKGSPVICGMNNNQHSK